MKRVRKPDGFTLIEVMITIAIIGILAMVAVPSYRAHIERGHRAGAKTALLEAAQFMERYRASNFSYVSAAGAVPALPDRLQVAPGEGAKRYDVALDAAATSATSFTLVATPSGWDDNTCGSLSLTNLGEKGQTAGDAATCWNR